MFNYKELRREHEVKQQELADIMCITQSNVSRMEANGIDPSKSQLELLIKHFGKEEIDKYYFPDKEPEVSDSELIAIISKQQDTINKLIDALLEKKC